MKAETVKKLLMDLKTIVTNSHVVYASGQHGASYINKDALYPYSRATASVCEELAHRAMQRVKNIEIVVAPAVGGVILSQWVAYFLSRFRSDILFTDVLALYAEKDGDHFILKRGYDKLVRGKRVLVVEDVLTSGGSAKKTVEAVRLAGGAVLLVGALCNRGGVTAHDLEVNEMFSLLEPSDLKDVDLMKYPPETCPLCAMHMPINTDVGHGAEFLAAQKSVA
ncbi:MAG: phosphoribosyltransferase family protein [bacterium]|nr:phosphoribosyltransferase family protein [bacterium]